MDISHIIKILKKETKKMKRPIVEIIALQDKSPFKVLISCILSLRTKDETTAVATRRLFGRAGSARLIARLQPKQIEKLIYPVGFYRRKAVQIKKITELLAENYDKKVPDTIEELLKLPGVGRKTANLVVSRSFNKPAICVDVHVYRILNRIGYVATDTPEETEMKLREILPKKHWIEINDILVTYGQNICRPVSPWCSKCKINGVCEKIGVKSFR